MHGYIYKISNTINDRVYIGKTEETVERRFYEHKMNVRLGKRQGKLYSAMKSYGVDCFYVETIDEANSREELCSKEKYWIQVYNSIQCGYNISNGGDGGCTWDQKGCKTVYKDGEYRRIHRDLVASYLEDGWVIRSKKTGRSSVKNTKWIHKDSEQKRVKLDELQLFLDDGWCIGYCEEAKKNLSNSHLGKEPSNKGVPCKESVKEKLHDIWIGSKHMNNGVDDRLIKKDEIEDFLNRGFVFGRLKKDREGGDVNE